MITTNTANISQASGVTQSSASQGVVTENFADVFSQVQNQLAASLPVNLPPSAYVAHSGAYSVEQCGSHIVNGVQLVPGAPGYDFSSALPYLNQIVQTQNTLSQMQAAALEGNSAPVLGTSVSSSQNLNSQGEGITSKEQQNSSSSNMSIEQAQQLISSTLPSNYPPSAYVSRSSYYSLETCGSHVVDGVQLIPGAPGYNSKTALPYIAQIAETQKNLFSSQPAVEINPSAVADSVSQTSDSGTSALAQQNATVELLEYKSTINELVQKLTEMSDDLGVNGSSVLPQKAKLDLIQSVLSQLDEPKTNLL